MEQYERDLRNFVTGNLAADELRVRWGHRDGVEALIADAAAEQLNDTAPGDRARDDDLNEDVVAAVLSEM